MSHWSNLFPIISFIFVIVVFIICAFFAIKWHFDQEKKKRAREAQAQTKESRIE